MQIFVLEHVIPLLVITFKLAVDSVSSNHIFALFLFLFIPHYLKKSVHGPDPKPFYKNKKVSMDLVHDRGSMEPVQSGGPRKSDIHGQEENGLELFIFRRHVEEIKQSKTLNQPQ